MATISLSEIAKEVIRESKKLRILDFDDTLVKTNSYVYVTHSNGKTSKLTPGEYAKYKPKKGDDFDYSDFDKVVEPKQLDMIKVLKRIIKSGGNRKTVILTARSKYKPIADYLDDIGVPTSKLEIVTLADGNPKKKADWIEGEITKNDWDDIYFADDSIQNVKAVKQMLSKYKNIKSKVQLIK